MQHIEKLTPDLDKLYTRLCKEYINTGLCNIIDFESLLKDIHETAVNKAAKTGKEKDIQKAENLWAVYQYAQNDY